MNSSPSLKAKLLNYILTIGFILVVILFLFAMLEISKFVFSDSIGFNNYVNNTKGVLKNFSEVEDKVNNESEKKYQKDNREVTLFHNKNPVINVDKISSFNIEDKRSITCFSLNRKVKEIDNTYYVEYKNSSDLRKSSYVAYYNDAKFSKGVIIDIKDRGAEIFSKKTGKIISIPKENVLGEVLYEKENSSNKNTK